MSWSEFKPIRVLGDKDWPSVLIISLSYDTIRAQKTTISFGAARAPGNPSFRLLTLAFSGVSRCVFLARTLGETRDSHSEEQSTNPNPGGHGIYVCLSTFRRQVIRQGCRIFRAGAGVSPGRSRKWWKNAAWQMQSEMWQERNWVLLAILLDRSCFHWRWLMRHWCYFEAVWEKIQTCTKKEKLDKTGKKINEFIKVY